MDRGEVLSGAAFTAVLRSSIVFLFILIAVGWAALTYVEHTLLEEFRSDVKERWDILAADHQAEGVDHVVAAISHVAALEETGTRALAIFDENGHLAGNLATRPPGSGFQVGTLEYMTPPQPGASTESIYYGDEVDGRWLVVGQRLDVLKRTREAFVRTLALTGFIVVLSMLAFGYFLSRQSLSRLREIEATLERASEGDVTARIPENGGTTQIDRLAREMNRHLDRSSRLMTTTRNTAAAVAHDLKSPLGRAYLALGRAQDKVEEGADPRDALLDAQDELERMRGIFDTYLQLSRIEGGTDNATFKTVKLSDLVCELAETYAMVAEDAGQNLVTRLDDADACEILGDTQMLQQLIVNLLQNAVNYGPEGNEISLELTRHEDRVALVVADKGPGIPETDRDAVFQPFYRLDPSRTKSGSGLGLALVRVIAERHGGTIALHDNHPGLRVEIAFPSLAEPQGVPG
ncbi:HAMP domain-containing histidine kinase [Stappia sp. BW2]|uniref:HAMP domain-containing sensor histidine kinase n=1 Tax=Stappia sp. BW2 TaxID=2592622 RepID=UPI0011DEDDEE|nr:HAMP domain-containing sensor histidine kinase [Stappia sp. BW2]TYC63120.1 HAMP domain-containing histidine kinase [Stappia sp. BW2]